jgi:pantothenate kinase
LHFLRHYGSSDELFSVDPVTGAATTVPWPDDLFPFLVVNIGSGASVLQVRIRN